jgi:hypothetical protein
MGLTVLVLTSKTSEEVRERTAFSVQLLADEVGAEVLLAGPFVGKWESYLPTATAVEDFWAGIIGAQGDLIYPLTDGSVSHLNLGTMPSGPALFSYRYVEANASDRLHIRKVVPVGLPGGDIVTMASRRYTMWGSVLFTREQALRWRPKVRSRSELITALSVECYGYPHGDRTSEFLVDHYLVTDQDNPIKFQAFCETQERYSMNATRIRSEVAEVEIRRSLSSLRSQEAPTEEVLGSYPTLDRAVEILAARILRSRFARRVWKFGRLGEIAVRGRTAVRAVRQFAQGRGSRIAKSPEQALNIPIVINNRNRLTTTRELVEWLYKAGHRNITILDNNSTYEPLLVWYKEQAYAHVEYLGYNAGPLALWLSEIGPKTIEGPYVYTDSDIVPAVTTPNDLVYQLARRLDHHRGYQKSGPALKIDDLPSNSIAAAVVAHERQFWQRRVARDLYAAPIDTTFALYRAGAFGGWWLPSLRLAGPYQVRHMPWYVDDSNLPDEERFYRATANSATTWALGVDEGAA